MTRHHARRSSTLVFEGEPSSVQTPTRRSRKGSNVPKAKGRHRRRPPTTHIRSWAAGIPEDVEDSDPPVEILTRKQGKQLESESEVNTTKDEVSKSPVHSETSSETEIRPEKIQTESSKAAVKTAESITEKKNSKSSRAAGLTDAKKAAAARKLPEAKKSDYIEINERNPPPVPDCPGSSAMKSHPSSVINRSTSDMAEHTGPSSSPSYISGSSRGKNKEKGKNDDADDVSVSISLQKVKGLLSRKKN